MKNPKPLINLTAKSGFKTIFHDWNFFFVKIIFLEQLTYHYCFPCFRILAFQKCPVYPWIKKRNIHSEAWLLLVMIMFFPPFYHDYSIKWLQVSGIWIEMYIKDYYNFLIALQLCGISMTRSNLWAEVHYYSQWSNSTHILLLCFQSPDFFL